VRLDIRLHVPEVVGLCRHIPAKMKKINFKKVQTTGSAGSEGLNIIDQPGNGACWTKDVRFTKFQKTVHFLLQLFIEYS
jgi:hypothetical protein